VRQQIPIPQLPDVVLQDIIITRIQTAATSLQLGYLQDDMVRVHQVIPGSVLPDPPVPNVEITSPYIADLQAVRVHTTHRVAVLLRTTLLRGAALIMATPKAVIHVLPITEVPDQVLQVIITVQGVPVPTAVLPAVVAVPMLLPEVPDDPIALVVQVAPVAHTAQGVQDVHTAQEVLEAPDVPIVQAVLAVPAGLLLPLHLQEGIEGSSAQEKYSRLVAGEPTSGHQKGKNLL